MNSNVKGRTFDEDFDVEENAGDLEALMDAWTRFHETTIRTLAGQPGRFSASATGPAAGLSGKRVYLWVFATVRGEKPEASL